MRDISRDTEAGSGVQVSAALSGAGVWLAVLFHRKHRGLCNSHMFPKMLIFLKAGEEVHSNFLNQSSNFPLGLSYLQIKKLEGKSREAGSDVWKGAGVVHVCYLSVAGAITRGNNSPPCLTPQPSLTPTRVLSPAARVLTHTLHSLGSPFFTGLRVRFLV